MEALTLNDHTAEEIHRLFELQQTHQQRTKRSTAKERIEKLNHIEAYLNDPEHERELLEAMQKDLGKPELEVNLTEIAPVLSHLRHVRKHLSRWMRPRRVNTPLTMLGTRSYIQYEPKGVCLIIAPWNYPLNLALIPMIYAMAAGNTVILKPSEISRHTSHFIRKMVADLYHESEAAVVEGDASVATNLLEQPFNHIYFTGSPAIGKIVMAAAAKHLASVTLELGGKSPALIDATVDVKRTAAKTLWGKCINAGQTCIAPDYLLVEASVAEDFAQAYQAATQQFFSEDENASPEASPDFGRIISTKHFRRLRELYDDAVEKGAKVRCGGQFDETNRFIAPTLLDRVTDDMAMMQEEIFGPLLPMITYRNLEEAISVIRQRPKPLTMYIASNDRPTVNKLLEETSAGGTVIKDYLLGYNNPYLPFGGVNNSGIGKSMGHHGFVEFSNERGIVQRQWGSLKFIYPPYTDRVKKIGRMLRKWA